MDWVQLISTVGFPIVACLGMGYFVKYQMDANNTEVAEMRKEHKEEVAKMTEAIQNNTLVVQKLIDKFDSISQKED